MDRITQRYHEMRAAERPMTLLQGVKALAWLAAVYMAACGFVMWWGA